MYIDDPRSKVRGDTGVTTLRKDHNLQANVLQIVIRSVQIDDLPKM